MLKKNGKFFTLKFLTWMKCFRQYILKLHIVRTRYINADTFEDFPKPCLNVRRYQVNNIFKRKNKKFMHKKNIFDIFSLWTFSLKRSFPPRIAKYARFVSFDLVACLKIPPRMSHEVFWIVRTCHINNWFEKKKKISSWKKTFWHFFWPQNFGLWCSSSLVCW